MHGILAAAIASVAAVFVGLTVLIVINKAWREGVTGYRRARRAVLEPAILEFIHGSEASLLAVLGGELRVRDRATVELVLLDHIQRVRGIERERFGEALDELGYVDRYLSALDSRRWWKRAEGAERLGLAGARRAVPFLERALIDESSEVRMRAAKALGTLGGTASVRSLIRALDEPNRWSTIRIADILTAMGREVVDELLDLYDELGLPGRLAALDVLGRIRPLRAAGWLHERLGDPEGDVRARACHALGSIGDPDSGPALVHALRDPEWPVRAMAAKALGRARYVPAIPELCNALRDREWWTRANAAEALRQMGAPGMEALQRMLDDEDTYARHQAVLMLEESGEVDRHVDLLARPRGAEREQAETLLGGLIRAGQTGRLSELARRHADVRVREALAALLQPGSDPDPEGARG